MNEFTITKKVSKQGTNNLIILPKALSAEIHPQDLVEVRIRIIKKNIEVN